MNKRVYILFFILFSVLKGIQNTSVILTWKDNSSYDEQYEIWAKKQGESDFHFLTSVPGNGSQTGSMSCEVQVERFNDYYFKVRAKKGNVYSEFSNSRWVTSSPVLLSKNQVDDFYLKKWEIACRFI